MVTAQCFLCSSLSIQESDKENNSNDPKKNNELDKEKEIEDQEKIPKSNTNVNAVIFKAHLKNEHKISCWLSLIQELHLLSDKCREEIENEISSRRREPTHTATHPTTHPATPLNTLKLASVHPSPPHLPLEDPPTKVEVTKKTERRRRSSDTTFFTLQPPPCTSTPPYTPCPSISPPLASSSSPPSPTSSTSPQPILSSTMIFAFPSPTSHASASTNNASPAYKSSASPSPSSSSSPPFFPPTTHLCSSPTTVAGRIRWWEENRTGGKTKNKDECELETETCLQKRSNHVAEKAEINSLHSDKSCSELSDPIISFDLMFDAALASKHRRSFHRRRRCKAEICQSFSPSSVHSCGADQDYAKVNISDKVRGDGGEKIVREAGWNVGKVTVMKFNDQKLFTLNNSFFDPT